jgi:SAM-dependent methyltransferase
MDIDRESREIWDKLGPWWDASVGDGDYFHQAFVFPGIEKLLDLQGKDVILDAGCGNGALSRLLAKKGAEVLGVDFSSTLIKQARERSPGIHFEEMDLTNKPQLEKLKKFDRVVCSMVLHDMSNILPFFASLRHLLKPNGSFVFSIPHPCFNSPSVQFEPPNGLTIKKYIRLETSKLKSKPGQPIEQLVFQRPMQEYFRHLTNQGMVMNGFEEPCVDPKTLPKDSLWGQRPEIPPALLSRWVFQT